MKITVAKSSGFCFGVKRALQMALDTAKSDSRVYMLGDIVHNEEVVSLVEKSGIKKIARLGKDEGKTLLIRAHGACRRTMEKAVKCGYRIVDATCPMVKEIHRVACRMEKKGLLVIVIGDRDHDEVHGIVGQLKSKAIVIDSLEGITAARLKTVKKAAVVVQSTQDIDRVMRILEKLGEYIEKIEFFNTICRPTRIKQEEIKKLPLHNDVMLIIGSKWSANTKRLYEISRRLNPRSYLISGSKDIKKEWLRGAKRIGIASGSSTPDSTTRSVVSRLKKICP